MRQQAPGDGIQTSGGSLTLEYQPAGSRMIAFQVCFREPCPPSIRLDRACFCGVPPRISKHRSSNRLPFQALAKPLMHLIATAPCHKIVLRCVVYAASFAAAHFVTVPVIAQQMQFPSGNASPIQANVSTGAVDIPQTNLTPIGPPPSSFAPPSSGFGQFDPYGTTPSAQFGGGTAPPSSGLGPSFGSTMGAGSPAGAVVIGPPIAVTPIAPNGSYGSTGEIAPSPPGGSLFSRIFSSQASSPIPPSFGTSNYGAPTYGAPTYGAPTYGGPVYSNGPQFPGGGLDSASVYGPPPSYGVPDASQFPSSVYPSSSPSVLFPGGMFSDGGFVSSAGYDAYRLFQGPRFRYDFVSGGNKPTHLQVNNFDVSLPFAFPNFLYGARPLFVIPSFSLQLWDGPDGTTGADLPANAYSGFLDIGWESDPNQMLSTEFGVRFGAFTDFDTFNSESTRILGKALLNFRMTPTATIKGGAFYLDRNSIKLIPAGGILWQPNPYTRLDLFFPLPKFSRYFRTIGTQDVWGYLAGDFGGGSWTIKRTDGTSDSVDINDLRVMSGIEWGASDAMRAGRRVAFFESGYVFNREIKYRLQPARQHQTGERIHVPRRVRILGYLWT